MLVTQCAFGVADVFQLYLNALHT